eukprot:2938453-Pleurochrysis_carterae.AAC.2
MVIGDKSGCEERRCCVPSGKLSVSDICEECLSLLYRLNPAAPPNIGRGGAVYPLTVMRLKVLRQCVGRGKP